MRISDWSSDVCSSDLLALDDFGTGYSSLGYLQSAPFDTTKLDQSFVRGATEPGARNSAIVRALVAQAAAHGTETSAERIESSHPGDLIRWPTVRAPQGQTQSNASPADETPGPESAQAPPTE